MTDYAYTGKKGTGKSKNAVRVARDVYLSAGRSVASNLDIYLEPMFGKQSKKTYIRIPDKPTAFDLHAAGHGNADSYDEDKNGALILDELGTWLNTRSFSEKDRSATLDYFAHARKLGWDCIYIMQNVVQVDKQLRESFIEFVVRHTRFDKVKIPFVGGLLCLLFGKKAGYFPRFHTAATRLGCNPQDLKTDSAIFTGKDIEKCYDTRQVFDANYPHGTYSVLSPWHVTGRYLPVAPESWLKRFIAGFIGKKSDRRLPSPLTRPAPAYAVIRGQIMRLPPDRRIPFMHRAGLC